MVGGGLFDYSVPPGPGLSKSQMSGTQLCQARSRPGPTSLTIFSWALLEKLQFENYTLQYEKYLTPEKYLEDPIRCKIEFRATFVFYTILIFSLPEELLSFEKARFLVKIFLSKYFFENFKAQ